ncbi:amidase [Roseovarius sp. 2305UL8-3]|uniref:amidase n=1 Tax=Roseovarius conchicola TaxID=3121636 RepID=UPI00352726B5
MNEIIRWSATETASAIATKQVSVADVTEAHLERVEYCEPHLRAVVEPFGDQAMAQARAMDANRPDELPPLWGLPVTVKINVDMAGYPNSNGVPALNKAPCVEDAPVVQNIKSAGAVIIGRTSTPEFSMRFFTSNPIYGLTLNPWDTGVTPGGSSGGASAAVASGMGVMGHGNDLGGSLRYPANCTGLATLRPSLGRVPAFSPSAAEERPMSLQHMSVQGMIARTVSDVRLAYGPLSRRSALDPLWRGAADAGKPRLGRVGICTDPAGDGVAPRVAEAVQAAALAAQAAGLEVVEVTPPMVDEAVQAYGQILNAEMHAVMEPSMREYGSDGLIRLIETEYEVFGIPDLEGFIRQHNMRLTCQRAWAGMFESIDALIMPVCAEEPFEPDQDFIRPETMPDITKALKSSYIINLLGLPSACVRTLNCRPVPLGVQVVGAMMDDLACLDVAHTIEDQLGFDLSPVDPAGM